MKEVETLIYSRMTGDSTLVNLCGGTGHIKFAFQSGEPQVPQMTYFMMASTPGILVGDFVRSFSELYQFTIFSNQHPDIVARMKRLFDGMVFTVPSNYAELGKLESVFDWEGPDGFDESLEVMRKDIRFRFFAIPKAQNPI
jgi:hypothetical protein